MFEKLQIAITVCLNNFKIGPDINQNTMYDINVKMTYNINLKAFYSIDGTNILKMQNAGS